MTPPPPPPPSASKGRLKDGYITAEPSRAGSLEETVVGTGAAVISLEEGMGDPYNARVLCTRCRGGDTPKKPPVHCKVRNGQIRMTCTSQDCECRCRTHYVGRDGRLRPYGSRDDSYERRDPPSVVVGDADGRPRRRPIDDVVDRANALARIGRQERAAAKESSP